MNEIPNNVTVVMQRNEKFAEDCSLAVLLQPFEMTPKQLQLLEAARKNDIIELETLLSKHVNVNARNNLDRTALHWAAANGNGDAIDVLLRAGANVNATDKYGMTPLLLASWFGHVLALEKLAKNKKVIINCFNKQGMNAIHCAAANDHLNVLEFLHLNEFTGKIDINKQELRGKTSLHLAAEKGFEEMVDYLLTTIASDPSPTDLTGRTALHLAATGGHYDVTHSLLQIPGLDINQPDNDGYTALHLASAAGYSDVVHLLMLANADINAQAQKRMMSALTLASAGGHLETVSQLLTNSICDRNHQNEDGDTAVHLASTNNSIHVVRLLITKGCDLNVANKLGQTPLHIGAEMGQSAIVQLLLASRADPNRRDGSGKTALALASRANHVSIADMIIRKERLQKQLPNDSTTSSECDPGTVTGSINRTPSADQRSIPGDNVIGGEAMTFGATRYQEDATEGQNRVTGDDRFEDGNLDDSRSGSSTETRNKQSKDNREIRLQRSGTEDQEQRLRSAAVRRETSSVAGIDEVDAVSGYPPGYHDNLGDRGDSGSVQEDAIDEKSENSSRNGVTDINPTSADGVGASGSNSSSPAHSRTPTPHPSRRDSGSATGCYLNTGFSLDEIIELRTGSRHGSVDTRLPTQPDESGSCRGDEISVLDSEVFLATSSTAGDVDSTAGTTDPAMSSAVARTDYHSPVAATDSARVVRQMEEPHSRNLSRVDSERSHSSGISFQVLERLESDSSVFEDDQRSLQLGQVAVRRQSSVDRMLAMKEVLWKLAMNQLKQGEWKRMAKHWQFTDEQIRAIEHQYTGSKSYRDHGYRMLVIWLECYLEVNPPPAGNPLRDLFDALVAINRRKLAEQIRNKCNRPSETRKSCKIS